MSKTIRIAIALLLAPGTAGAAEHLVSLKNSKFSATRLQAKLGDEVSFRNDDPVLHSIFSRSSERDFDLGSFGKGETRKIFLTKEGRIEVRCANHPEMRMIIEVVR